MDDRWTLLPNASRVLQHAEGTQPAWLWSADGQSLLWSNDAATLFLAKIKKHGLKRAALAVPIKGQVSRIIRLGSAGRSSLARIQFLAGDKPVSATCTTTPLAWENGEMALLIVAVDPIAADVLMAARNEGDGSSEEAVSDEPVAAVGPDLATELDTPEPVAEIEDMAADQAYAHELQDWREADAETVYEPGPREPLVVDDTPEAWEAALHGGADPAPVVSATHEGEPEAPVEAPEPPTEPGRLSALVARLAADDDLYSPLGERDDYAPETAAAAEDGIEDEIEAPDTLPPLEETAPDLFKVTGRGFMALPSTGSEAVTPAGDVGTEPLSPGKPDGPKRLAEAFMALSTQSGEEAESVERVSRYNFDELSRILTDRVGERGAGKPEPGADAGMLDTVSNSTGSLISLGGETLVLNRLPLGILVFRDQQILFANRAITTMVGYESIDSLRQAGLSAIFPAAGENGQEAGPVNHLVQRDGTLVPVTARLQSTSWQGRPALMLSASTTEVRTGHEDAVRAFAQSFADLRGDGFIEATRSGTVSAANAAATTVLMGGQPLTGRTVASLVGTDDGLALKEFLERPARFAETTRPCLPLRSANGKADIMLFAMGQAGVISGYFGFVQPRETAPARIAGPAEADPALLARISRGVRRPLNTIIGFSDLIRSQAFGQIGNDRYEGYADDIARAGQEIAALVDELDDYARLRDGRYLAQRASLDLTSLLESCVIRIRDQANGRRVIVRNAISETLPRVTADRASLAQAVLNLLASAIDQTPTGGAVVISAQRLDDGAIAIHVRDSSAGAVDMAERFVVFRDGLDRNGQILAPIRSSVGLALTRSLLAVNAVSLSVDPAGPEGMLFTLRIPADLVDARQPDASD